MANQNNQNQTSPLITVCVVAFMVIAAILYFVTDMMILSMALSAFFIAVIAAIGSLLKHAWSSDKKALVLVMSLVGSGVLAVGMILLTLNACIPTLSEEEIKSMILEEVRPQIDEMQTELGVTDLTVELTFKDFEYRKPTIFESGRISCDIEDVYVSSQFTDLESGKYTVEIQEKYYDIDSIDYDDVDFSRYYVSIDRDYGDEKFRDSKGAIYTFEYEEIYKDGYKVFDEDDLSGSSSSSSSYSSSSSSSSSYKGSSYSSSSKCPNCNGSGYVRYYSSLYDEGTVGPCPMCN
ncbi:MAG: hypothetical protein IIX14_05030 [Clostridia bacterium]|nr:hypothetical protein [Clostridia bacterium]